MAGAGLAAAALGLAILGGAAVAQQAAPLQEVTVVAERTSVTKEVVGRSTTGAPIEVIQVKERVSFWDLDLATFEGVKTLDARITNAAGQACTKLDRLDPVPNVDAGCAKKVADAAKGQVEAAVAAAKAKKK
jgi:UrcA family protein